MDTNLLWSIASINPPAVAAMPPPPMVPLRGPDIHVPSAWQNLPSRTSPQNININHAQVPNQFHLALPSNVSIGYRAQHAQYSSEWDCWACLSYCPPSTEMITLDITAIHEGGTRKGCLWGTPFGMNNVTFSFSSTYFNHKLQSICEGKQDIDARVTASKLVAIVLSTLIPNIKMFCPKFTWHDNKFIVHDSTWVDLLKHPVLFQPYFYKECLQPGSWKNSKTLVFKSK